jgi:hypothetical protein
MITRCRSKDVLDRSGNRSTPNYQIGRTVAGPSHVISARATEKLSWPVDQGRISLLGHNGELAVNHL